MNFDITVAYDFDEGKDRCRLRYTVESEDHSFREPNPVHDGVAQDIVKAIRKGLKAEGYELLERKN